MKTNISEFIDLEKLDALLEGFNKTTGFVTSILDFQGNILSKSGWRQICTDFHRAHSECAKRCTYSDTVLADQMKKGEKYHAYTCLNGLTDVVVPLKIKGQHVANLFSGQFFFEEPDIDFFKKQAATFGFDEKAYITALQKVPVVSEEQVKTAMDFLLQMTDLISELGFEKVEQAELNKNLIESENKYRTIFNSTGTVTMLVRNNTYIEMANNEAERVTGFTAEELTGSKWTDHVAPHSLEKMLHYHKMRRTNSEKAPGQYEVDLIHKSGEIHRALLTIGMIPHSELSIVTLIDITERYKANQKLKESEEQYTELIENMTNAVAIFQAVDDGEDFIFKDFNKAGEKIENIQREELIGKKVTAIFPAVKESGLLKVFQEVWKTGQPQNYPVSMYKDNRITGWQDNYVYKLSSGEIVAVYDDVTNRKQTEEALRVSKEKFSTFMDTAYDLMSITDKDGRFTDVNESMINKLEYSRDELIGKHITEILPEEAIEKDFKPNWPIFLENGKLNVESTLLTKNGNIIDCILKAVGIYDKDDNFIGSRAVISDISERKQAETELIKLSTAVQQSPATIAITDTQGRLEYVNPKFTEVTGYSLEEATGQFPSIMKSGEHHDEMYKELWKTILSGKTWRGEFHNKKKNGELFWESATVSPIFDEQGEIIKYIKIAEDITEQKRNGQIQQIVHNISNAVITSHNLENFIQLVKEELGKIIDTTNFYIALYDEKTDYISLPFHHDEKDKVKSFPAGKTLTNYVIKTSKPLLATKAVTERLEQAGKVEQIGHPSEVWLGVPLKSKNKLTGIFAVQSYDNENAYDESDVKILEIISHQISLSLDRLKAEENLKHAVKQAQESDRLKSAFLANMSHEIRTPMNGILGFTNLLKEPQLTGDEKDEYIRIIEKSGKRMLNTINDIVDISKIEAGQVEVVNSEVSVNKLLEEHYNFFRREAKSKGLELIYKPSCPDNESHIITDHHKLEGILTNLIKNAIKYTEAGNITFGCSLKTLKEKDVIEFYVKDTGIGIPEDRVNAIFNRFEQADIEDSRVFQGSGLGLAISKSYVEMLGGEISVKSKEGEGSTFTFSIPYVSHDTDDSAEKKSEKKDMQTSFKNASVIIAEDDKDSQFFLQTVLSGQFDKIIFTTTGEETIEALKKNPSTDLILMDIKMPGMNGYDATREIRKFNRDIRIIAQTAYGLSGDEQKAIDAGCDDYISKPIKKEILLEKIVYLNIGANQ